MSASEPTLTALAPLGIARDDRVASNIDVEREVLGLFDDYQRPLLRYVASFGLSRQEAEDVVQEVFLSLFRHLLLGRSRSNLPGWLFQVAHNIALKQRRRRRHWWSLLTDASTADDRVDPAANPEDRLTETEEQHRLQRVLRALPERDRQCVLLRAEGLKYRDIAAALGISLGAVAKSMARAVDRFKHVDER
ncbi:MAG: sigma-70 family RNA polymerase sigma factor [Vicinamibacterales bacterium]